MKKKLLALVHGEWSSHTVRAVEIAKALRCNREYNILFSGKGEYMDKIVSKEGFDYIETPSLPKEQIYESVCEKLIPRIFNKKDAEKYYDIELRLIENYKPDIILRDHFREFAGIVAKQKGIFDVFIQGANCSNFFNLDFRPSTFPKLLDKLLPKGILMPVVPQINSYIRKKVHKAIFNKALEVGIAADRTSPEGYEPDLTLFPDAPILFPFKIIGENYKFIGPLLCKNKTGELPWTRNFINDKRKKIIITNGSSDFDDKTLLFIEALKDEDYAVIIDNCSLKNTPKNFYCHEKTDIESILQYADLLITHGGLGSTYMGLTLGIPMLVLPNHFEQEINGNQVKKIKAGLCLMKKNQSIKNLKRDIEFILENSYFKENALTISENLKQYDARKLAVKYIEEGYEEFKTR